MSNEIETIRELRIALRTAKNVYTFNPLTEGYVKVYKNDFKESIRDMRGDTDLEHIYVRFNEENPTDLYIG